MTNRKYALAYIATFALVFCLVGCSQGSSEANVAPESSGVEQQSNTEAGEQNEESSVETEPETEPEPEPEPETVSNEEIAEVMKNALSKRWKKATHELPSDMTLQEHQNFINSLIDIELDALGVYTDAQFEDEETAALLRDYISILEEQKSLMKNYIEYQTLSTYNFTVVGENRRFPTLEKLVDILQITFDDSDAAQYEAMMSAERTLAGREMIDDIFAVTECGEFETYEGGASCKLKITNQTNLSFDAAWFTVRFYDADGVQLESDHQALENVEPDGMFWLSFYCRSSKTPATVKYVSYEIGVRDSEGVFSYVTTDDCAAVNPVQFDL